MGDVDEALRIRQEEQLPVYERLGAVRSRAVTLNKIANGLGIFKASSTPINSFIRSAKWNEFQCRA